MELIELYCGLSEGVKWESIINMKDKIEDDRKEYVAEIIESVTYSF